MRTVLLIAVAGLTELVAVTPAARAQYYLPYHPMYYGWSYPRPYYAVPYGFYPAPYYPPPPFYAAPPWSYPPSAASSQGRYGVVLPRHRVVHRVTHRPLVNPLLGPLPGATSRRRN